MTHCCALNCLVANIAVRSCLCPFLDILFPTRDSNPMTAGSEDLTSVIFIGNPGVGKSTLHNALGGSFKHGFSPVVGMPVGEPQEVECNKRRLLLVDVPGIRDHGQGVIDRNLSTLQSRLNNGNLYVVFFVIVPNRDGSISLRDLALMQLVLESVENGPQIGLIMTQKSTRTASILFKHLDPQRVVYRLLKMDWNSSLQTNTWPCICMAASSATRTVDRSKIIFCRSSQSRSASANY